MKRRLRHQIQVASPGLFFLWPPTTEAWSHSFCLFSRLVFVLVSTVQLKATYITQHNSRNLRQSLANQLNLHLPKLVAILASFWHFQNCIQVEERTSNFDEIFTHSLTKYSISRFYRSQHIQKHRYVSFQTSMFDV